MDDRNTMDRLLAGEALTPTEAAVFGAEFARRFERRRYACEPDDEPGEMDLNLACSAVDALNAALAEARASAPVVISCDSCGGSATLRIAGTPLCDGCASDDLLYMPVTEVTALRSALAARPGGTDNTKEPDHA